MNDALQQLASTGVVGALLVVAIFALRAKDKELQQEKAARIDDAKAYLQLAMSLQEQVITAVNKLSEIWEAWEKREEAQKKHFDTERDRNDARDRR